jgi:replicative DNA helicase
MVHYLKEVASPLKTASEKLKKTCPKNDPATNSTASKNTPKPPQRTNTVRTEAVNDQYTNILKNGAQDGQRNQTATKLAGHLFAKGLDEGGVWEILKDWNENKNAPPLDEDELQRTFESIRDMEASKEKPEKPAINAESFLDTPEKVVSEYRNNYVRIPFADTYLNILQAKMNGGLAGGCLYILGGIPSSGKTCLANYIADNICLQNHPVLFFSCDDGATELRYRTYSRFSGFDIEDFNRRVISKSDIEAIATNQHLNRINPCKYVVPHMINIEDWPKLLSQIRSRHQKAPVIVIDYLRKLRTNDQQADERLRVDSILSQLTELAKKHNTPVIAISELARDSYKSGQRLSMASFKESGSIEYEASWLGILAAVEENGVGYTLKNDWERIINHDGNIDLIVFKAKRGTGETGKIPLKMYKSKMTFRDRIESGKLDTVNQITKSKYD